MNDLNLHSGLDHPTLPKLRLTLRQALADAGQLPAWTETYADDPTTAPLLRANGRPLFQVYGTTEVPSADTIRHLLCRPARPVWQQRLGRAGHLSVRFLSALFIAFFPKCPFCWAAYMSYAGATGIASIPYRPGLIWLLSGLLTANVGVLYWTRHRHGLGPFWLCLLGATLVILNRLWLFQTPLLVLGVCLLLLGSLWSSLSRRMTDSLKYYIQKVSTARKLT